MDNKTVKRFLRFMVLLALLAVITIIIGLFFAFGGNSPILIHATNIIDMVLIAVTILFVVAFLVVLLQWIKTGSSPDYSKAKNEHIKGKPKASYDDLPELAELIDNLDSAEASSGR